VLGATPPSRSQKEGSEDKEEHGAAAMGDWGRIKLKLL
jgi:hypothetical protein